MVAMDFIAGDRMRPPSTELNLEQTCQKVSERAFGRWDHNQAELSHQPCTIYLSDWDRKEHYSTHSLCGMQIMYNVT